MPLWLVKATWCEDEAEASEKWEANAETVQDAVVAVATRLRYELDGVEKQIAKDLSPGEARRVP